MVSKDIRIKKLEFLGNALLLERPRQKALYEFQMLFIKLYFVMNISEIKNKVMSDITIYNIVILVRSDIEFLDRNSLCIERVQTFLDLVLFRDGYFKIK